MYTIFNIAITATLCTIVISFFLYAIESACQEVKAKQQLLDSIPYMSWNELRALAKANSIHIKRGTTKYALANLLIMELA